MHTPSVVHIERASAFVGSMAEALLETDPSATVAMRARTGRKLPVVVEREGKQETRELAVPGSLP